MNAIRAAVSGCEASFGVAVDLIEVFENHLWIR